MLHLKSSHCINKSFRFNSLEINELPPHLSLREYLYHFTLLLYLLSLNTAILSAQTTSVRGTKTDKVFANTTEIYKSKAASDAQVLAELESEFGIGDVVRISDAPPASTTVPLSQTTSVQSDKKAMPAIPKAVSLTYTSTPPLSNQALVISSGSYKSDIEMPEKKIVSEPNTPKAAESTVERKSKAYSPPSVKSSRSTKSYKKSASSSKKFLFFFKKTTSKSSKRAKYKDNNKFGCYKF